jgi:hypothetical protein
MFKFFVVCYTTLSIITGFILSSLIEYKKPQTPNTLSRTTILENIRLFVVKQSPKKTEAPLTV